MDANIRSRDARDPRAYEVPTVTDYGRLTDITAGASDGGITDRTFPVNTPKRELTFS
jgi:hypothetical protein